MHEDPRAPVDVRLGGHVVTEEGSYGSWRVLSQVSISGVREAFDTPVDPQCSHRVNREACLDQLWLVTMQGRELANVPVSVNGGTTATPQLPVEGAATPGGFVVLDHSQYRMRFDVMGRYGAQRFTVDTNSPPFNVTGAGITATLLVPPTHVQILTGVETLTLDANGQAVDGEVGIALSKVEQSSGKRFAHLTDHLTAAAGIAATIQVPPKARDVTIYQTAAGVASPAWDMIWGAVATGVVAGRLPFIAGTRRTEQLSIPPNVSLLQTDIDGANARQWTIVWTIHP